MMTKKLTLLTVFVVLALSFSVVSAQMTPETFCGDLSAADCELLTQAEEAMTGVESFGFDINMDFVMSGVDLGMGSDSLAINMVANGSLAMDADALAPFESMDPEDMAGMMEDMPAMMTALFNAVEGEGSFTINLPAELMTADMPDLSFDLVMVGGVLYMDIGPVSGMSQPSWMGIDIAGMYSTMFDMGMAEAEGMDDMDFSELYQTDLFTKLTDPGYLANFMSVKRLENTEVMGQQVAVFEMTLDYGALLADPDFRADFDEYMATAMAMQGMTPEMMGDEYSQMMDMVFTMLEDFTISTVQWVGLDDHYIHHAGMTLVVNVNMAELAKMDPSMAMPNMPTNVAITFEVTADMHNFNEPITVTAPEGAQVINPMMFMGNSF